MNERAPTPAAPPPKRHSYRTAPDPLYGAGARIRDGGGAQIHEIIGKTMDLFSRSMARPSHSFEIAVDSKLIRGTCFK